MNQSRDLPPQVEPRSIHEEKLTGFQLRFDGRPGDAAQSGASHDSPFHGADPPKFERNMKRAEPALDGIFENGARAGPLFAQHPACVGQRGCRGSAAGEPVARRRDNRKFVLTPGKRFNVGVAGESFDPSRVTFKLPYRRHHMLRVSNRQMEASIRITPCEPADHSRQHVVANREAGTKLDVQRPVFGSRCDVAHHVQHLDRRRQQFAARRVLHNPAAIPVKELALQLVFELRKRLAGGCLGKADALCGSGDGAFLIDGREDLQLAWRDLHACHCKSIQPNSNIDIIRFPYLAIAPNLRSASKCPFRKHPGELVAGTALCLSVSLLAWAAATLPWNHKLQLSALTLAILAGMAVGNAVPRRLLERLHPGLRFSQQKLLRLGIVLYGIRLTVHDLSNLGPRALAFDLGVIACVLLIGYWLGTREFGLDADTALLVSAGSGICGAAAVLATERVIESESHKVSVAVATVVVFGTTASPLSGPLSSDWFHRTPVRSLHRRHRA